jgi:hypothetical protein
MSGSRIAAAIYVKDVVHAGQVARWVRAVCGARERIPAETDLVTSVKRTMVPRGLSKLVRTILTAAEAAETDLARIPLQPVAPVHL